MNKYGIYITSEPCHGIDALWEQYTDGNEKPSRKQIIESVMKYIDYLSKFIRPSVLIDFIKSLDDQFKGEEMYDRLCENISYVKSFEEKSLALANELYTSFFTEVFGEPKPWYADDNYCHILLFPKQEYDTNLYWLIRDHESFKSWFLGSLSKNKMLYSILVQGVGESDFVKADVVTKLKPLLNSLEYYKKQIIETKKGIKNELSRINDSMVFEEYDKEVIKKAKEALE